MHLWELDIHDYLDKLSAYLKENNEYPYEVQQCEQVIELFNRYQDDVRRLLAESADPQLVEHAQSLIDLDARLYFLLEECAVSDGQRSEADIMSEFKQYYRNEYLTNTDEYPFDTMRLIKE